MMMSRAILIVICAVSGLMAFETNTHGQQTGTAEDRVHQMVMEHHDHEAAQASAESKSVGLDEKLGQYIPMDGRFTDHLNESVVLGSYMDNPTLLLPVYYSCPQACNLMMASLASALNDVPLKPGQDFRVLSFGFDDEETPEMARRARNNYLPLLKSGFPEQEWKFLTGKAEDIRAVLDAAGYRIVKTGKHMFLHPNVLIVLAEDGKIIRYIYGTDFLPFDIGMALTEAAKGTPGLSIRKLVTYCFDYDPENKRYVFRTFRVVGVATILLAMVFLFFLLRKGKPRSGPKE